MAKDFLQGRGRFCLDALQIVLMLFAVLAGGLAAPANAQSSDDEVSAAALAQPILTVIVTRHGVRSISKTPDEYEWADWGWDRPKINPADLTEHGYQLMIMMGQFYRDQARAQGAPVDCTKKNTYVYADKDQRTLFTAQGLIKGLCNSADALPIFHEKDTSLKDPMFDATTWLVNVNPAASAIAVKAVTGDPSSKVVNSHADEFSRLQRLIDTRCQASDCQPVWAGENKIKISGTGLAGLDGPLATASSYAEDLFLEYAQCRPFKDMGSDPYFQTDLQAAMRLHVLAYDVNARNSYNPRVRGGTLFAHIVAMLADKAGRPWGKVKIPDLSGKTLVIFSGHDTELGSLGGILDAHWQPEGGIVTDDMPPGSALIFDLFRAGPGYRVRLRFASMTVPQFRRLAPIEGDGGIRTSPVVFNGCTMINGECTAQLENFVATAESLIGDKLVVYPSWIDLGSGIPAGTAVPADPEWTKCGP